MDGSAMVRAWKVREGLKVWQAVFDLVSPLFTSKLHFAVVPRLVDPCYS
jgi:hypothetical protein